VYFETLLSLISGYRALDTRYNQITTDCTGQHMSGLLSGHSHKGTKKNCEARLAWNLISHW
jgi:hypothetical protein